MTTVGLIGLGAMGSGMASSLRRAGHSVQVFDVRREVALRQEVGFGGRVRLDARRATALEIVRHSFR